MVVSAVQSIDQDIMPLEMIGIKKVPGGALEESRLINGVAFKKTFRLVFLYRWLSKAKHILFCYF